MSTHEELHEEADERENDLRSGWKPLTEEYVSPLLSPLITRSKPGIEEGTIEDSNPDTDESTA